VTVVTETIEAGDWPRDRRLEIACSCVGRCSVLFIVEWDGDEYEPPQTSFDFYTSGREDTWRQRFRSAWRTLRGKGGYYHGIVITPDQAEQLGSWLLNRIDRTVDPVERRSVVATLAREGLDRAKRYD
jgi:hypothetical protein